MSKYLYVKFERNIIRVYILQYFCKYTCITKIIVPDILFTKL